MNDIVLALDNVTLDYGSEPVVESLTLHVRRGEILGLLGPNGSGKSSTLAAIVGELCPTSGHIRLLGLDPIDDSLEHRRRLGFVPQELAVFDEMTAADNLRFFGRLYGLHGSALQRKVSKTLDFVQLSEHADRLVSTFSGGMQRRVNLGCALLHEPRLLLLDEPTVGLDIRSRDAIFASLLSLRERGCAMIYTTHHLEEAERLCDRIAILHGGRLQAHDDLATIVRPGKNMEDAYRHWTSGKRAA